MKVPKNTFASSFVLKSEKPQRKRINYCSKHMVKMQCAVHYERRENETFDQSFVFKGSKHKLNLRCNTNSLRIQMHKPEENLQMIL